MKRADFERDVAFPPEPFSAAVMFMAVMAYPEQGAGLLGQPGSEFAASLVRFAQWACAKSRGLRHMRAECWNPRYLAPRKREFKGSFERGMRRVTRRLAASEAVRTQMLRGYMAAMCASGMASKTPNGVRLRPVMERSRFPITQDDVKHGSPSIRQVIRISEPSWSRRFALNKTNAPADPAQKKRDLYKRAFIQSRPVLHMADALVQSCYLHGPKIRGWGKRDPITAMLLNAKL